MTTIDVTAIILAVIGMVSGWMTFLLNRRKHKQEVNNLEAQAKAIEAETERKYMELAKMYVDEFTKNIVRPLELRLNERTNKEKEINNQPENGKKCVCYCENCSMRISVLG